MAAQQNLIQVVAIEYRNPAPGIVTNSVMYLTDAASYTAMGQPALPFLSSNFLFSTSLFSKGSISGVADIGLGDIQVDNTSGRFDEFKFYGFDGRPIKIYTLTSPDELLDDATNLIFSGIMEYPEFEMKKATFHIKTKLKEWEVPCQSSVFSGGLPADPYAILGPPIEYMSDATDPEGFVPEDFVLIYPDTHSEDYINRLDGEESLAGKVKPMLWGRCLNVPMTLVNSSKGIYSCNYDVEGNRKGVGAFNRIYDQGVDILFQLDYATSALLLASPIPDPGYYKSCLLEGLIWLGSSPTGDITADIDERDVTQCSAPAVMGRILYDCVAYAPGVDYNQGDLDYLSTLNSCPVGLYIDSTSTTIKSAIDLVASSAGIWCSPDKNSFIRFGRVDLPIFGEPVASFTNDTMGKDSLARLNTGDDNRSVPVQQVTLKHTRIWQVLSQGQTLESVDLYLRTFMANEYRATKSKDPDILELHPFAPSLVYETLLLQGQRALLRNWDFSKDLGEVSSDKADWIPSEEGTGPAFPAVKAGQLELQPTATAKAKVTQRLKIPGQFTPGVWRLGFTCIARNVDLVVLIGSGSGPAEVLIASADSEGDYSGTLTIPDTATYVDVILRNTVVGSQKAIVDNVYMQEVLPGRTPAFECVRRLKILKSDFERYKFECPIADSVPADLGSVIQITTDRFNLNLGKKFIVVGKVFNTDKNIVDLDVVG